MGTTKQIPTAEWSTYFDRFTKQHLDSAVATAADVEVLSAVLGDEFEATTARLLGLAYDTQRAAFQIMLEDIEHLVFTPSEIWVIEEDEGFVSTLAVVNHDGSKQIIYLRRGGAAARQSQ
jgi:hypothetical protein